MTVSTLHQHRGCHSAFETLSLYIYMYSISTADHTIAAHEMRAAEHTSVPCCLIVSAFVTGEEEEGDAFVFVSSGSEQPNSSGCGQKVCYQKSGVQVEPKQTQKRRICAHDNRRQRGRRRRGRRWRAEVAKGLQKAPARKPRLQPLASVPSHHRCTGFPSIAFKAVLPAANANDEERAAAAIVTLSTAMSTVKHHP